MSKSAEFVSLSWNVTPSIAPDAQNQYEKYLREVRRSQGFNIPSHRPATPQVRMSIDADRLAAAVTALGFQPGDTPRHLTRPRPVNPAVFANALSRVRAQDRELLDRLRDI